MGSATNPGFEEQSKKLENAMNNLVEELDKSHLRRLHADMHTCAAKCCQRREDSLENVYSCVETCRFPVDNAWGFVEGELQVFHEKLSQCLDACATKTKWISQTADVPLTRSTRELGECSNKCVESMIKLLPSVLDKMKNNISRNNQPITSKLSNVSNVRINKP